MVLPLFSDLDSNLQRGGVHHVGEVVTIVLNRLKAVEWTEGEQLARPTSRKPVLTVRVAAEAGPLAQPSSLAP